MNAENSFHIARHGLSERERTRSFLLRTKSGMTCAVGGCKKYNNTVEMLLDRITHSVMLIMEGVIIF